MKNVGLIGAGGYAYVYVDKFLQEKEAGKINFAGVVIRPGSRAAIAPTVERIEKAGVPIFPDKDSLFQSTKLDVLALPVAIGAHCPLTVEALQRGINVIVEKPAAGSLEEIDRMREAEKQTGKFVVVAFQHTHEPNLRELKKLLLSGKFGAIKKMTVMGRWPRNNKYYQRNDWVCRLHGPKGEPVYDSPINNAFAHYLNLCLFLSGTAFDRSNHMSSMQAELYRARRNIETFDTCAIRLQTVSKAEIVCLFTHACEENVDPMLRIECENGLIHWTERNSWSAEFKNGKTLKAMQEPSNGINAMHELLLQKLEDKKMFMYTLELAREHTFCIEHLHKHFEVTDIPEKDIIIRPEDGQHIIRNISEVFNRCFAESKLPSEIRNTWK